MKIKVTNIDFDPRSPEGGGLRGLNAVTGPVRIEPGQIVEVEMTDAERAVSERTGWFHFGDNPPPPPDWLGKSIAQRRMEARGR